MYLDLQEAKRDEAEAHRKAWDTRGRGTKDEKYVRQWKYELLSSEEKAFHKSIDDETTKLKLRFASTTDKDVKDTIKGQIRTREYQQESILNGTWDLIGDTPVFWGENTSPATMKAVGKYLGSLSPEIPSLKSVNLIDGDEGHEYLGSYMGYDKELTLYRTGEEFDEFWDDDEGYSREGVVNHEISHHVYYNLNEEYGMNWFNDVKNITNLHDHEPLKKISYYMEDLVDARESEKLLMEETFTELRGLMVRDPKKFNKLKNDPILSELIYDVEESCKEFGGC